MHEIHSIPQQKHNPALARFYQWGKQHTNHDQQRLVNKISQRPQKKDEEKIDATPCSF
jgi:hypothetical protein